MYQLRSLALDQLAFFCLQQRPANGVHGHAHLSVPQLTRAEDWPPLLPQNRTQR